MREEAEPSEPVIEAHQDDTAFCELASVVNCGRASAIDEPAAIYPKHHGQLLRWARIGSPNICVETILGWFNAQRSGIARKRQLHAIGAEFGRGADRRP